MTLILFYINPYPTLLVRLLLVKRSSIYPVITLKYLIETLKNKLDILLSFLELSNFTSISVGKVVLNKRVVISLRINRSGYPLLLKS